MDRCAVFVDAGYVYKMAELLLADAGGRVAPKYAELIASLRGLAERETGLPLLRIYWYDAATGRSPTPQHRHLARLDDVKLRLGNLKERDGKLVQKGVDAELHADMTQLARNGGACDLVLVSGDEDMLRAVEESQSYGARVHLWGVDADGTTNQSLELIMTADRRYLLDNAWVNTVYTMRHVTAVRSAAPSGDDSPPATEALPAEPVLDLSDTPGATVVGPPAGDTAPGEGAPGDVAPADVAPGDMEPGDVPGVATPGDVAPGDAASGSAPVLTGPDDAGPAEPPPSPPVDEPGNSSAPPGVTETPRHTPTPAMLPPRRLTPAPGVVPVAKPAPAAVEFVPLSELTTLSERSADSKEDAAVTFTALQVGITYAQRWALRSTSDAIAAMRDREPDIPRAIDRDLLGYAELHDVNTWTTDERNKFDVRRGFWEGLSEAPPRR